MRAACVGLILCFSGGSAFRVAPSRRLRVPPRFARAVEEDEAPLRRGLRLRMAGLGVAGFVETSYLTVQKVLGNTASICGTQGCQEVLTGPFSHVGPLPLTVPGAAAYLAVALLALAPLVWTPADPAKERWLESSTRLGLFFVSTAMAGFSAYLMLVLGFVIRSPCPYCFFSAFCSFSLAALAWTGGLVPMQKAVRLGAGALALTFCITGPLYLAGQAEANLGGAASSYKMGSAARSARQAVVEDDEDEALELMENAEIDAALGQKRTPKIFTKSTPRTMRIADKLEEAGAKFYGAYWCGHCYEQKRRLGAEAMKRVEYFECAKDGKDNSYSLCKEKKIPGFPTWELHGEYYPGEKTLAELEEILGIL